MTLLIVIPACAKDVDLALANLRKLIELDGKTKHAAIVAVDKTLPKASLEELLKLAKEAFAEVHQFVYSPWLGSKEWPRPQNHCWQSIAREVCYNEAYAKYAGWLFWEPDCCLLKGSAFDMLAEALKKGKKPFLGHVTEHGHMNGVAVYPVNLDRYSTHAFIAQDQPFDVILSRDLRIGKVNSLVTEGNRWILHTFKRHGGDEPSAISPENKFASEAVLFHGATHSTSNRKELAGKPLEKLSFTKQTQWESGLFLLPSTSNVVYFNPTLLRTNPKWFLICRRCTRSNVKMIDGLNHQVSDLVIFEFDEISHGSVPQRMIVPQKPERYPLEQWEDPRAWYKESSGQRRMMVSCATWVQKKDWKIRQAVLMLGLQWDKWRVDMEPIYGGNHKIPEGATAHEKNWVWFEHPKLGNLCVYQTNPLEIFQPNGQQWRDHQRQLNWGLGQPRGGTPPVRVGDEMISFFHSSGPWIEPKRRYYMGAFAFRAEPPFAMTRFTQAPLLCGSEHDPRFFNGPPCVFPGGAVLKDDVWNVVFGVNDENCGWIKIPHKDLNERLLSV